MNLLENIRLAFEGLKANKMRALLTMLGIIIGIGSVIAILTVGNGLSGQITSSMGSLGATNIYVFLQKKETESPQNGFQSMMSQADTPEAGDLITEDMIDSLSARFPDQVAGVSVSESAGGGEARDGHLYANVSVMGVNDYFLEGNNVTLLQGRGINDRDVDGNRSTAVVSDKLVGNMFGGNAQAALGQELQVRMADGVHTFSIVGVYKYVQSTMSISTDSDKDIRTSLYIPVSTAKKMMGADAGYQYLTVTSRSAQDTQSFLSMLEDYFNRYYARNENYQVAAISMENILEQVNSVMNTVNIALSVIAGISLLVGGIGVMNIMLVSVTERTREIGTRKALGATNGHIRIQFVVESTIICIIGGFIGVLLGGALGYLGSSLIGAGVTPSLSSILIAVGFSMGIGIFFGYYPANKAAKLDPIEALRYE